MSDLSTMEVSSDAYERLMHRSKLMDLAQDVLIVLDANGVVLDINQAVAEIHGRSVESLIGTNCVDMLHPTSVDHMLRVSGKLLTAGVDGSDTMLLKSFDGDGNTLHVEVSVSFSNADQKFYVVQRNVTSHFQQTSELQKVSESLRVKATTDTLTGVANRSAFDERMEEIGEADEDGWLVILDVDHFKSVNDTHGHVVGDALLKFVADELLSVLYSNETLSRIGGDEFAIVAPVSDEVDFAARIEVFRSLFMKKLETSDDLLIDVGVSLGASRRVRGEGKTDWMRRSDREMYADKLARRQQVSA